MPPQLRSIGRFAIGLIWGVAMATTSLAAAEGNAVRVLSHTGHRSPVTAVALLGERGLVVSGGDDRSVIVWDAQSGAVLQRIKPRGRVLQILPEPGATRLWIWTRERAEIFEPECFDALTGGNITGVKCPFNNLAPARVAIPAMKDSSQPAARALWQKLAGLLGEEPTSFVLSQDQRHTVLGFDGGRVELWEANPPRRLQVFETRAEFVHGVSCSGDGTRLATWKFRAGRAQTGRSAGADLRIWDLTTLQVRRCDLGDMKSVNSACLTKDGRFVYVFAAASDEQAPADFRLLEVDARAGTVVRQIGLKFPRAGSLRLSPDDSLLAVHEYTPGDGARIMVWNRKQGVELRAVPWIAENRYQSRGAFFPDNRSILAGVWERPAQYDLASGKRTYEVTAEGLRLANGTVQRLTNLPNTDTSEFPQGIVGMLMDVDVRADGQWVGFGATHRGIGGHEVINLTTKRRWLGDIPGFHHLRFRPQYPHVIVAGTHRTKTIQVRQLETGKVIDTWSEEQAETDRTASTDAVGWTALMDSLTMTADGRRLFVVKTDGALRMLELSPEGKFQRQLELVPVGAADWCAILPNGHYGGSPAGIASVRLVRGNATLPLTQLDVSFNRPDEILEVLGAPSAAIQEMRRLVDLRASKAGAAATADPFAVQRPSVRLTNVSRMPIQTDQATMDIEVSASGASVSRLTVLVNGVPWPDRRGVALDQGKAAKKLTVPLRHGVNRIQVSATNSANVESLAETVQAERTGTRQRHVHLLAVGVSEYANTDFNLHFAASDAREVERLAAAWKDQGCAVKATVLTNGEATREKILAATAQVFRSTGADDLAVIFLSGHGVIDGAALDRWFFCPHDHDFVVHTKRGLGYEELMAAFDGAGAQQRLLLIDSCHSGEIEEADSADLAQRLGARGVKTRSGGPRSASPAAAPGASQRILRTQDVFADFRLGAGAAVIGASAAAQFALESAELRQGVFTNALISGLGKGGADLNRDGRILASELHQYVTGQVVSYTEGAQQPSSRGINPESDFALLSRPAGRPLPPAPPPVAVTSPEGTTTRSATGPTTTLPLATPDDFIRRYFAAGASSSTERQMDFFGNEIVRYFDVKKPTPAKVQADLSDYEAKWPVRRYTIVNSSIQPTGPGTWRAAVNLQFFAAKSPNDPKPRSGQLKETLLIATQNGRMVVRGIWVE